MLDPKTLKRLSLVTAVVTEMAITVVLGVVGGYWLDEHLGSGPIFLLVLSLAALAFGIYRLSRSIPRITDDDHDTDSRS